MAYNSQICIIGAGPTGIMAVKHCLEYGLSVMCYEKEPMIGGMWLGSDPSWSPTDASGKVGTAVYNDLLLNTSQYNTTFADFPLPDDLTPSLSSSRRFLNASELLEYLNRYAKKFKVDEHVTLSAEVMEVKRLETTDHDDRVWEVTVRKKSGESFVTHKSRHQYVIVGSGLYSSPRIPTFPGMEETSVKVIHSGHVHDARIFAGQRVLVVGGGVSSGDMVQVALENKASKVTWTPTRRPSEQSIYTMELYPFNRKFAWDEWFSLFSLLHFPNCLRFFNLQKTTLHHLKTKNIDNLVPDRLSFQDGKYVKEAIHNNRLVILPTSLQRFNGNSHQMLLLNGQIVEADICVLATGYEPSYPFLNEDILEKKALADVSLYNSIVTTTKQGWGLFFLFVSSSGMKTAELEGRWLAHQIANKRLFSDDQRMQLAKHTNKITKPFGYDLKRFCFDVCHSLALELDCAPKPLWRSLLSPFPRQRRIGLATAFGPWLPQQYRLRGPHSCPSIAEETILKVTHALFGWKFKAMAFAVDIMQLVVLTLIARYFYLRIS